MLQTIEREEPDRSGITADCLSELNTLTYRVAGAQDIPLHKHKCYEMVLVERGACKVYLERSNQPLLKGDLFLSLPGLQHAFSLNEQVSLFRIQFEPALFINKHYRPEKSGLKESETEDPLSENHLRSLLAFSDESLSNAKQSEHDVQAHYQIVHLNPDEVELLRFTMQQIANEQKERNLGFEDMKRIYLAQLLLQIERAQVHQLVGISRESSWKDEVIGCALKKIAENPALPCDFESMAQKEGVTLNYFRCIFKEVTGLSPLNYLNKVRILKALELLQTSELSISEISALVGIDDSNYFSRLFKKVTGSPPRYFKAIPKTNEQAGLDRK